MTTTLPLPETPAPPRDDEPLVLKLSTELGPRPQQAMAGVPAASAVRPVVRTAPPRPMQAHAQSRFEPGGPGEPEAPPPSLPLSPGVPWLLVGLAGLAGVGWVLERRRRRALETEKDSVLWAHVQPPGPSIVTTADGLDDILPDSPNPAEAARAIYVTAISETSSRREATLIDLHQLNGKLQRRRARGDAFASVLLLQQHLVDFRYTSPWAFLELRELYKTLDRQKEWEITRQAFRRRFGQNAPAWDAPAADDEGLLADEHLCRGLARQWPYRESRMFVLRWLLGEHEMRQKSAGPPLLGLQVYRDLLFVDALLDQVMLTRQRPVDSLL
ncbi:MAG TPA: hypothetical protein VLI46_06655 [Ramlibacter sp.]|nr:hypothetical protein [Ramlibacter sp.]